MSYDEYKVSLPEGRSGSWRVERYTVTQADAAFERLRCAANPHRERRHVPAGEYTRLVRGGTTVMSDTPDEIRDHLAFIRCASGHVLIAGLGLGMVLKAVLRKPNVTAVTVIEQSQDVINLVGPTLADPRLTIVNADIFAWKPAKGARFDWAWFDIWDYITSDNLPEMTRLHRRFARYGASCSSWCHATCRRHARSEKRSMARSFAAVGGDPMRRW